MTHFYKIHIETGPPEASFLKETQMETQSAGTQSENDLASQQHSAVEAVEAIDDVRPLDKDVVPDRIEELLRLVAQLRDDIDAVRREKEESKRQWDSVFALVTEITNLRERPNRPKCSCADVWCR